MMIIIGDKFMQISLIAKLAFSLSNTWGVPVSPSRLHLSDWTPLVDKSNQKLDVWKGGTMLIAGRAT